MYKFISKCEQDTINFAENFAKELNKKDIIVLSGDLGSGKTKFVQGILKHFGLENGKTLLSPYFKQIELKRYDDYLIVDDAKALMNYIMSCHGNQKEYLGYRLKEFQAYLEKIIDENNGIKITKDCGLFICRK